MTIDRAAEAAVITLLALLDAIAATDAQTEAVGRRFGSELAAEPGLPGDVAVAAGSAALGAALVRLHNDAPGSAEIELALTAGSPPRRSRLIAAAVGAHAIKTLGLERTTVHVRADRGGAALTVQVREQTRDLASLGWDAQTTDPLRQLGTTAVSMAHGLNTDLAAIAAQAGVLLRTPADLATAEALRTIERIALDASATTARILRQGRPAQAATPASGLRACAIHAAETFRLARRTRPDSASVSVKLLGGDDPLIHADPSELREIILNLLNNAADAMPTGGEIALSITRTDSSAVLACRDNGVGMPPEVQARAFDPFFSTKGDGGTGMGLAIVYSVVSKLGGDVALDSTTGQGTCVTLRFPLSDPLPAVNPVRNEPRDLTAQSPLAERPLTVLVVDDDERFRQTLARLLALDGASVVHCGGPREATALLAESAPDLVLIDEQLGDSSGTDLARSLRTGGVRAFIALVSGMATRPDDAHIASAWVDAVLPKPLRPEELSRVLALARQHTFKL
ncbi:MAG: ATP-binding protein [Chloroflexota bacterium]